MNIIFISKKYAMKYHLNFLVYFFVFSYFPVSLADQGNMSTKIQPGEYVFSDGMGSLLIQKNKEEGLMFSIETYTSYNHYCGLEGNIINGQSIINTDNQTQKEKAEGCIVTFRPDKQGVIVSDNKSSICNSSCGMGAYFNGHYEKIPKGCTMLDLEKTRKQAKEKYDKEQYEQAFNILKEIKNLCSDKLAIAKNYDSYINDLALVQYQLGDSKGCLKTLQIFKNDFEYTKDYIVPQTFKYSSEEGLKIVKTARFNYKLCSSIQN